MNIDTGNLLKPEVGLWYTWEDGSDPFLVTAVNDDLEYADIIYSNGDVSTCSFHELKRDAKRIPRPYWTGDYWKGVWPEGEARYEVQRGEEIVMNIHEPDTDFKRFATQLGEWIASGELYYLDLTDSWGWFGEWLEWLNSPVGSECSDKPGRGSRLDAYQVFDLFPYQWPPTNIILLGRASTQEEADGLVEDFWNVADWRLAVEFTPIEEIDVAAFLSNGLVEQIIVKPPEEGMRNICSRLYEEPRDSIISQVWEIRGRCQDCRATGNIYGLGH